MADEKQQVGSWDDADFTEGGFFDDKDGTIVKAEAVTFDYQGKSDPICALHIEIRPDDAESDDDNRDEYYKIGDLTKFTPSSDGERYIPVGTTTSMNKNAKAALFLLSLKNKGFQLSKLAKGISALVGLHCHFNIVAMPDVKLESGEVKKDLKILVVTKIYDEPAKNAGKGASDKPKAKKPSEAANKTTTVAAAAPGAAPANTEAGALLEQTVVNALSEAGGKLPKSGIPPKLFAAITDAGQRSEAMKLYANAAWFDSGDRPWVVEGGEVKFPGM